MNILTDVYQLTHFDKAVPFGYTKSHIKVGCPHCHAINLTTGKWCRCANCGMLFEVKYD